MTRLLRAALAILLAAPALHHPRSATATLAGVRPREEVYAAAAPHHASLTQAPAVNRGARPASGADLHPPAFVAACSAQLRRGDGREAHLRASSVPVPRSAKRPAYYATAPPA